MNAEILVWVWVLTLHYSSWITVCMLTCQWMLSELKNDYPISLAPINTMYYISQLPRILSTIYQLSLPPHLISWPPYNDHISRYLDQHIHSTIQYFHQSIKYLKNHNTKSLFSIFTAISYIFSTIFNTLAP